MQCFRSRTTVLLSQTEFADKSGRKTCLKSQKWKQDLYVNVKFGSNQVDTLLVQTYIAVFYSLMLAYCTVWI